MAEGPAAARGVFVAGTDTGVGKTLAACALLHAFAALGLRSVGMKPVAAGAVRRKGAWHNDDVAQLRAASSIEVEPSLINPYCFAPAVAPHIAAAEAGVRIRIATIAAYYARLARAADVVVVEGAGGLLVPLGRRSCASVIPLRLGIPVVLVVGLRLGCLNHALLTVDALQMRGLRLAGWIASHIDPRMSRRPQNLDMLQQRIRAPLLGILPHARNPRPDRMSRTLDINALNVRI
ncbi:MAG: dethiobiotin synthase [Burkholderiales bacterium]|nr:dethiobiotin synthase [Burkholderiales bacterium]